MFFCFLQLSEIGSVQTDTGQMQVRSPQGLSWHKDREFVGSLPFRTLMPSHPQALEFTHLSPRLSCSFPYICQSAFSHPDSQAGLRMGLGSLEALPQEKTAFSCNSLSAVSYVALQAICSYYQHLRYPRRDRKLLKPGSFMVTMKLRSWSSPGRTMLQGNLVHSFQGKKGL